MAASKKNMKCHYEVLSLDNTCSNDELKKAYRKLALLCHPDKNKGSEEEATERFRLVQEAYTVLTDPQERAWYDRHREDILNGGAEYEDKLNIMSYFRSSVYKGFDDSSFSFYTVYCDLFTKITTEDKRFAPNLVDVPTFGKSVDDYMDSVKYFYDYWCNYRTERTFVWLEVYNTREAPNRKIAKLMEKDNKKLRDKARKEWNEKIRELVSFIKKRDKRVLAQKELSETIQKKKQLDRQAREHKIRMDARANVDEFKEADWAKSSTRHMDELESKMLHELGIEDSCESESDDDNDLMSDLYCIACNRLFRTPNAFENHEFSKKHRINVQRIKDDFLEEMDEEDSIVSDVEELAHDKSESEEQMKFVTFANDPVFIDAVDVSSDDANDPEQECEITDGQTNTFMEDEPEDKLTLNCRICDREFKTSKAFESHQTSKKHRSNVQRTKQKAPFGVEETLKSSHSSVKVNKKKRGVQKRMSSPVNDICNEGDCVAAVDGVSEDCVEKLDSDDDRICPGNEIETIDELASDGNSSTGAGLSLECAGSELENIENGIYHSLETIDISGLENTNHPAGSDEDTVTPSIEIKKASSKKRRRKPKELRNNETNEPAPNLNCNICRKYFPTRNKLFKHITDTGHAIKL